MGCDPQFTATKDAPIPLLDIQRGNQPLRDDMLTAIAKVIDSGAFLHGPDVKQLEASVAELCGTDHAVSCASGSDAVLLSLMALDIGCGDEVIVPSFTFFATASAVWRLGAKPVFVDIEPETFNIDPAAIEAAVTPATKAIIPVHLFGQVAAMDAINQIAERHGLHVIEDAAQAIGASKADRAAGAWGDVACFSFYPTKNLGACGDAGIMTVQDADLADRLRLLAGHGMRPRYFHKEVGINSRLDTVQAAILNVKLARLQEYSEARRRNAKFYDELFKASGLDQQISLPKANSDCYHVWNQYTIRVPGGARDALRAHLGEARIGSEIYYPIPLHMQECFAPLGYKAGCLPHTEQAARDVLALPIFPELTADEQRRLVGCIGQFMTGQQANAA